MPDSVLTLTREQLYEQVWSEPVRTLAKRYGLSDVGLAKTSGVGQPLSYSPEFATVPSGQLSLVVRESWGHSVRKSWDESEQCPLEDRLNEFLVGLVARAVEEQEFERRRAENERERQEAEAQRLAAQRRREEEAARVRRLEQQAVDWSKSRQLVEYLGALRKQAEEEPCGIAPGSPFAEWLAWATDYAFGLNPVPQVLANNSVATLPKET